MKWLILEVIGAAIVSLVTTGVMYYFFVYLDKDERRKRRCPHCDFAPLEKKADVCPRCGRRRRAGV